MQASTGEDYHVFEVNCIEALLSKRDSKQASKQASKQPSKDEG